MRKSSGFSLIELVMVIVIIGILSTLGVRQFHAAREQSFNREAQANLRLILAAERVFRMEDNPAAGLPGYVACAGVIAPGDCNTVLRLLLPAGVTRAWDYQVAWIPGNRQSFCAQATRTIAPVRRWRIRSPTAAIPDPLVQAGNCP